MASTWLRCIVVSLLLTSWTKSQSSVFEIGTYILTQNALDDAPTRYATWITRALNELNNQTLDDYSDSTNNCWYGDYYYTILLSQAHYNFTWQEEPFNLFITDSGFYTSFILNFWIDTPVDAGGYVGWAFVCWSETNCDHDWVSATSVITSHANVTITFDSTTGKATVVGTPKVNVGDATYDASNCGGIAMYFLSWFSGYLTTWVETTINEKIQESIDSINNTLNVPQTFSPYEGVNVTYNITSLQFAKKDYAKVSAEGLVKL